MTRTSWYKIEWPRAPCITSGACVGFNFAKSSLRSTAVNSWWPGWSWELRFSESRDGGPVVSHRKAHYNSYFNLRGNFNLSTTALRIDLTVLIGMERLNKLTILCLYKLLITIEIVHFLAVNLIKERDVHSRRCRDQNFRQRQLVKWIKVGFEVILRRSGQAAYPRILSVPFLPNLTPLQTE